VKLTIAAFAILAVASGIEPIKIASSSFEVGGEIPAKFTCNGANVSPEIAIGSVPKAAKSLVLIVDDPDAPSGLFTHWLAWNIDPQTTKIAENSAPAGAVQGTNDFSKRAYGGPCPPSGTHRYFFKVFALDLRLDLKPGAKRAELDKATSGHILAQGELMAHYAQK
jgi:Raf kinase inhibitor-like YbhB/YbcL family protein